ncbi:Uncharacterised protein [Raoultella planticola]|uniref:Uncharacterized protein n=1 Tax=Raoultella planticola TaxID=575 RepID=A0A8G2E8G0_RAOPL|nr:Uncharacterised protein [Raoultella planticola]
MKIDFKDYGAVAAVTITSTIFEFRKHNRVVDATLLCTPGRHQRTARQLLHEDAHFRQNTGCAAGL